MSNEVELKDLDFDSLHCDLEERPVYLPMALGNGTRYNVLLAMHVADGPTTGFPFFADGKGLRYAAEVSGLPDSALWVGIEGKGAYPFGLRNRPPLADPLYVGDKLGLLPGDRAQVAYLISGVRAALQHIRVAEVAAFEAWCRRYEQGWQQSDADRLPAPVAEALGVGVTP